MKIAVEGCMHGDLDIVYETIQHFERVHDTKIDLLLCCGDFQAVRNEKDLDSMHVSRKLKEMKSFWKYYSGQEIAPVTTIFIGGDHEASNYLWELYYGGWAAPNIYFLGFAGVVRFGNIRIGGLSGIHNPNNYQKGRFERPPYNESTKRSTYHVREYEVCKLKQIKEPIDIFLSHEWPRGVTHCGNRRALVKKKRRFRKEKHTLGSRPAAELLEKLKPQYWFSAHLHREFSAVVQHGEGGPITKFLALDKCLPGRKFLQIIEIESDPGPFEIQYDEEWLAITRRLNPNFPLTKRNARFGSAEFELKDHRDLVKTKLKERGTIPFEFSMTAPPYNSSESSSNSSLRECLRNPQTVSFLKFLGLSYLLDKPSGHTGSFIHDTEESFIDDVDELEELAEGNGEEPTSE